MSDAFCEWLDKLPAKAAQFSIVFVQCGHAASSLKASLATAPGTHVEVTEYLDIEELDARNPLYIHSVERFAADRGGRLGSLRKRVTSDAEAGRPVILVSTIAKTAYPDTVGSDVISDAKQLFVPICEEIAGPGVADFQDTDYFASCVRELGDQTLAALAESLWELQLSPINALGYMDRIHIEALRGAALVQANGVGIEWRTGAVFKQFRNAVAQVSSEYADPGPSVPDTFSELWALERIVRDAVRRALVSRMGEGWRESCLAEWLSIEVLERARKDSHPLANRLKDLRDPLEWLTTSELLALRETRELGELGLESYLWTKLRNEIVPIRNKVAHMRMVTTEDAMRARTWRRIVQKKLQA